MLVVLMKDEDAFAAETRLCPSISEGSNCSFCDACGGRDPIIWRKLSAKKSENHLHAILEERDQPCSADTRVEEAAEPHG